jgi:SAM-dependent methyltransferase
VGRRIPVVERPEWRQWVTPTLLRLSPVHRWFVFPHSYTGELVETLLREWGLQRGARVLDPFAGAGTTAVTAQSLGMTALAFDLSPLAVLASRVKTSVLHAADVAGGWARIQRSLNRRRATQVPRYPDLVNRALPGNLLATFHTVKLAIERSCGDAPARDFFMLALLGVLPKFSKLVATGGWLSFRCGGRRATSLSEELAKQVSLMIDDLRQRSTDLPDAQVEVADARVLPLEDQSVDAAITSPPYVNRHDYTRVFGVELLFALLNDDQIKPLRYQSFQSHPEAHPNRPSNGSYRQPRALARLLSQLKTESGDPRIPRMLEGYFKDIHCMLAELARILRPGARAAVVIGNVQYNGVAFPVDEITARIGERFHLSPERLVVARYRGNSAQQMAAFGRKPARESVVILRKVRTSTSQTNGTP